MCVCCVGVCTHSCAVVTFGLAPAIWLSGLLSQPTVRALTAPCWACAGLGGPCSSRLVSGVLQGAGGQSPSFGSLARRVLNSPWDQRLGGPFDLSWRVSGAGCELFPRSGSSWEASEDRDVILKGRREESGPPTLLSVPVPVCRAKPGDAAVGGGAGSRSPRPQSWGGGQCILPWEPGRPLISASSCCRHR